jgi:hypothetical protein
MPSTRAVLFNTMYNFKGEAPVSESVDTDEQKILVVNSKPSPDAQGQPRTAYFDERSGTIFIKHQTDQMVVLPTDQQLAEMIREQRLIG